MRVVVVPQGAQSGYPGIGEDISIGGMFVATLDPLPFGCALTVRLTLPKQEDELILPAVVRWVRPGEGMGVQFKSLGVRETHALTLFLDAALKLA